MSAGTVLDEGRRPLASADRRQHAIVLANPVALAVLGLALLAAVLRFARLGHQGFWFDEGNTALLVHFSPGTMLGQIPKSESTPPLYYCVAWVWARLFGYSEAPLRSLSALAGVATVPVAYAAGAKLISRRAGLIAAALTACNPLLIWYSQEARSYALLVLLSAVALLAFAYARETPTPRLLAAWVIASALALATHYYAVLAIAPQALWLLGANVRRRSVQIAVGAVGLCGLALVPLALAQNGKNLTSWIATVSLTRRLGEIVPQFLIGFGSPAYAVLEPLAIGVAILALVLVLTRSGGLERRGVLLAGALALAGLALNLVLIAAGLDDLITRNVLAIWMPATLALAGGLAARRARLVGVIAAVALCGIGVVAAIGVAVERNLERPDWRVVATVIGHRPAHLRADVQGRAILVQHYRDLLPLSLYLPRLKFVGRSGVRVAELDVVSFTSPRSAGFCWWGSACNLWPSVMQPSYSIPGFHEVWRRRALQFTILRLVAEHPVRLTARVLSRVLRKTRLRNDELLLQR